MSKKDEKTYGKQQFLRSKKLDGGQKDLLNALLMDGQTCTQAQAKDLIEKFLKKEVK